MIKNAYYFILKTLLFLKICVDFLAMYKNSLIRKIRLISKFMTSQPDYQTVTLHILLNMSQSKGSQKIKFGQVIEYNKRNIFFKNHAENETRRLVPDLLFFKKVLYEVKAIGLQLNFNMF